MMLVKATEESEAGVLPTEDMLDEMGKYNEELVKAGVMLAGEGLQPTSKGARVDFSGGKPTVTDGPFAETKELIAGFWLIQAKSKEEAIEWARRVPFDEGQIEIRQVFKLEDFGRELAAREEIDLEAAIDDNIGDDLLRLVFTACHPVLSKEARVALTLRLLGGLTTEEIARAFLVPVPTVAQRIVRAKRTLVEARVPFEVPAGSARDDRLASVLEVVYLIFNEGYSATEGDEWVRPELCEDALRLGRILAKLRPGEPEAHGLIALMELQASRLRARTGSTGEPI